jgi:hypothetical protein
MAKGFGCGFSNGCLFFANVTQQRFGRPGLFDPLRQFFCGLQYSDETCAQKKRPRP